MTRAGGRMARITAMALMLAAVLLVSRKCGGDYRPTPDRWLSKAGSQGAGCIEGESRKCA